MKLAKASDDEIKRAIKLAQFLEATCDVRNFEQPSFPEDDTLLDEDSLEDLQRFYKGVKELCPGLLRVVFGYQVLLDNCCDPAADTLEWKPELAEKLQG